MSDSSSSSSSDSDSISEFSSSSELSSSSSSERCQLLKYQVTHSFRVEGVKSRLARKKTMRSSPFFCLDEPNAARFYIKLKFGKRDPDYLSCYVVVTNKDVYISKVVFEIMDVDSQPLTGPLETRDRNLEKYLKLGFAKAFNLRSNADSYDDNICIKCEVFYDGASQKTDYALVGRPDPHLHDDYLKLYTESKNAEVTFIVGAKKFKAHKEILMARSSYFRAIFNSAMKEAVTNEVVIKDANPDVFEEMLKFFYTGLPPKNLSEIARFLLPLADRYDVTILKSRCVSAIINTLTLKNVIEALLLADAHDCPRLKKKCLPLVKENVKKLKTTEDWRELKKNPDVLASLLELDN